MFKTIKIKKGFFFLFLLLTFLAATSVFAEDIIGSVILVLDKQKENYKIYEQGENYVFDKDESSVSSNNIETISNFNEVGVNWYVIFDFSGQKIKVYEQDLNWQWQEDEKGFIGKTEFYGCPAEINYFYDESRQLKVKASFTNLTGLSIDNLEYKFIVKHSKDLSLGSEIPNLEEKAETGEFSYNDNAAIGLISVVDNEPENKNELIFNMPVGTVAPGELSQVILNLF